MNSILQMETAKGRKVGLGAHDTIIDSNTSAVIADMYFKDGLVRVAVLQPISLVNLRKVLEIAEGYERNIKNT